ncbi:MAG: DUF190 domain-containing protein [Parafilimonas sp.]
MELQYDSKLLRIFVGEADKLAHQPLYEAILFEARNQKLAGCTVMRGIMSFGASAHVHTAKLIEISQDLPLILEIVDHEDKINAFAEIAGKLIEESGCGGLITIEKAGVLYYKSKAQKDS